MRADASPRSANASPGDGRGADARRALARHGEDLAAAHLDRLGFAILARNVRSRAGEIDLIAFDGRALAFVEVKTRRVGSSSRANGVRPDQEPLGRLGARQRVRLRGLALAWLRDEHERRPHAAAIRFDAVGVIVDGRNRLLRLEHVEGAW